MTFEDLQQANRQTKSLAIKSKDGEKEYIQVNERVKAFRMLYPEGTISTDILAMKDGVVTMKATVLDDAGKILSTALAQEKESSSFINKTSYVENCETSAVGRALGFLGIGIDVSIASFEEVSNAINNQGAHISEDEAINLSRELQRVGGKVEKVLQAYNVSKLTDLTPAQYMDAMGKIDAPTRKNK